METRQRGNPPGNTNGHVAMNLRIVRQRSGVDLRSLAARMREAGRTISASALSKIENGDRRVDVRLVRRERAVLAVALAGPRQRQREVPGEGDPLHPGKATGRAGSAGRAL